MQQYQANQPRYAKDEMLAILTALAERPVHKMETREPVPTEVHKQHPMLCVDFWFICLATAMLLLVSSSMIEAFVLEHLIYAALFCNIAAMCLNLTRTEQEISVYKIDARDLLKAMKNETKRNPSLKDRQIAAGIKPVTN